MALEDEATLLRELHAGLAVAKSQQSEINRRLGNIERDMVATSKVAAIEKTLESRQSWTTWAIQTAAAIVIFAVVVALGKLLGLELAP